jgi:hypothetical protein
MAQFFSYHHWRFCGPGGPIGANLRRAPVFYYLSPASKER